MPVTRRKFLASTSMAAFVVGAHELIAWTGEKAPPAGDLSRITALRLQSGAPLPAMREFYGERLGLPILEATERELTIAGGQSTITFVAGDPGTRPFYHFAFNIPENKIRSAFAWQSERSELLPNFPHLRDPDYPERVVHFRNWNAHSIFFQDPAENLVEYIARHDLDNGAPGPFSTDDILHASEIAFIVDDVPATARGVQEAFDLGQYKSGGEEFHAVGDEHGLLLLFRRGRNLSLAAPAAKLATVYPTEATIRGPSARRHEIEGFPYVIVGS